MGAHAVIWSAFHDTEASSQPQSRTTQSALAKSVLRVCRCVQRHLVQPNLLDDSQETAVVFCPTASAHEVALSGGCEPTRLRALSGCRSDVTECEFADGPRLGHSEHPRAALWADYKPMFNVPVTYGTLFHATGSRGLLCASLFRSGSTANDPYHTPEQSHALSRSCLAGGRCVDPTPGVQLAGRAVNQTRRGHWLAPPWIAQMCAPPRLDKPGRACYFAYALVGGHDRLRMGHFTRVHHLRRHPSAELPRTPPARGSRCDTRG